jgi:pSer/pThr/pTyr-binding forkhead associated (FHA) protein
MQVQLIITDGPQVGQLIPVNLPAFKIGRAEGADFRLHSLQVSRNHCIIHTDNGTVTVRDLGSAKGTYVNGNPIFSQQVLKDGDKLVIGPHLFVVSILAETEQPEKKQNGNIDHLASAPAPPPMPKRSNATTVAMQAPKQPEPEAELMFGIRYGGQTVSVTKSKLFDLAQKGRVQPDDLVTIAGTKVFADSIHGIVFGSQPPVTDKTP